MAVPEFDLTCPKCGGEMCTRERGQLCGAQCVDCGGIFLQRHDLERLIDAEVSNYTSPHDRVLESARWEQGPGPLDYREHPSRSSVLSDLFD